MKITNEHIDFVHQQMDRMNSNNVSIYLPEITGYDIMALRKYFKVVQHEFFGYVYFEKKDTP